MKLMGQRACTSLGCWHKLPICVPTRRKWKCRFSQVFFCRHLLSELIGHNFFNHGSKTGCHWIPSMGNISDGRCSRGCELAPSLSWPGLLPHSTPQRGSSCPSPGGRNRAEWMCWWTRPETLWEAFAPSGLLAKKKINVLHCFLTHKHICVLDILAFQRWSSAVQRFIGEHLLRSRLWSRELKPQRIHSL